VAIDGTAVIDDMAVIDAAAIRATPATSGSRATRRPRRPGRVTLAGGIALSLGLAALAAAWARPADARPTHVDIPIRYSHYERTEVTVQAGTAVTFVLHNGDPIDHEWIVGDAAVHERHRKGTEPVHDARPTEVTIPAGTTRTTTVTFATPGTYQYICHLPGHEAYGMVGTVIVEGP
jgi:plastocyanin